MSKRGNTVFALMGFGAVALTLKARSQPADVRVQNARLALRLGGFAMASTLALHETTNTKLKAAGSALVMFFPELLRLTGNESSLEGLGAAKHQLYSMPAKWWQPDPSRHLKDCYQSKADALMQFAKYNQRVIDNYSGISHNESPAEFDAINVKYGLEGDNRVTNIAQAIWVSMPPGRPYCLTRMAEGGKSSALYALNQTSPAKEDPLGQGFAIPDFAMESAHNKEQAAMWREQSRGQRSSAKSPTVFPDPPQDDVPF